MMRAWFAAVLVSMTAVPTFAQDKLKLAIGQIDAWSNMASPWRISVRKARVRRSRR